MSEYERLKSQTEEILKEHARELAESIARDLFTDGSGVVAERLVLENPDGNLAAGWGEKPMADRIARTLLESRYLC